MTRPTAEWLYRVVMFVLLLSVAGVRYREPTGEDHLLFIGLAIAGMISLGHLKKTQ